MRRLVLITLLLFAGVVQAAPLDDVLSCMRENIPPTVRIQTVEIAAFDRTGGERQMRGKLYGTREKDRVRLMLRIEAPPDLAGAAYLVREDHPVDEMYIYLPALNKVRRIYGTTLDTKLWGTDLSYNDVKQVQNAFTGASAELEPAAELDGRPVHVLRFVPREGDGSQYSLVRAYVDQKTCVALKVEFLEGADVRKALSVAPADLKRSGKHWYAAHSVMRDLKDGTRTHLRVIGVTSGDKLSARYFNPNQFYLGH